MTAYVTAMDAPGKLDGSVPDPQATPMPGTDLGPLLTGASADIEAADAPQLILAAAPEGLAAYVERILGLGMDSAPALILGLTLVLAIPVLLAFGVFTRPLAPEIARTKRMPRAGEDHPLPDGSAEVPPGSGAPGYRDAALIELASLDRAASLDQTTTEEERERPLFRFGQQVLLARIGRETDNEIRLDHSTVHRYHAIIERRLGEGYVIADLSDTNGNGVLVNGERIFHRLLRNGDVITLGAARLRFDAGEEPSS